MLQRPVIRTAPSSEDQHCARDRIVLTGHRGQTGLNDFRDHLPQVQPQQHGRCRGQQGKTQRDGSFCRGDALAEISTGFPLLFAGEAVCTFLSQFFHAKDYKPIGPESKEP